MRTGEELTLIAMKKEFKSLSRKAGRAKKSTDEYMEIGSELLAIHNEFAEIVKSGEHGKGVIKKLDALKVRSGHAEKIRKKDLIKLLDKQSEAEIARDALGSEIQMMEFRLSLRKAS